jgi:hypothetical protein
MSQFCEKNMNLSVFLAFERIKIASTGQKSNEKVLKNIINLLQRIEKYKLKQSFSKLVLLSARTDRNFMENYYCQRAPQFGRKISLLVKRQKKGVFDKIVLWARFIKSYSKVRVIAVIRNRL